MADNPVLRCLGRRLRLGVIGGGGNALIGPVHRTAARLDDRSEVVAGVLSSNPERSLAEAAAHGIPRGYRDVRSMIAAENARADGIDAVSIATPNDSHQELATMALEAGLDVICDKPLTNDLPSARDLVVAVRRAGTVFCLTHNYSGYPLVREARAAIAAGEIGPVRVVHVTYMQGSLGSRVEDDPAAMPARLRWRLDPAKGGISHVMGDIGTHAHQLLTYVTGERVASVLADVGAALPGRTAHDTGAAILRLGNGARGVLLASKAATGAENTIAIEVYGEAGGVYWEQANANTLRVMRHNKPAELRTRGLPTLHPLSLRASRIPPGHPEAFFEAFANLYADFAELAAARRAGIAPDPLATHIPTVEDGAHGLAFIDACLASTRSGGWVECPGIDA
jgi:predicted dehydrogenase